MRNLKHPKGFNCHYTIRTGTAHMLHVVPWFDPALIDRVFETAATNPTLLAAVNRAVELRSEEAKEQTAMDQKASYERLRQRIDDTPEIDPVCNPEDLIDLIDIIDTSNVVVFGKICRSLAAISWYPLGKSPQGREKIPPALLTKIIESVQMYLNAYPVCSAYSFGTEYRNNATCGYWALRLLTQVTHHGLDSLNADVWYACMPSVA
jgi:hypothetical protein